MKTIFASVVVAGLVAAPLANASGDIDEVRLAVQSGSDFGITHFQTVEFDSDDMDDRIEIEGWLDDSWFVELDMDANGTVTREDRQKRSGGARGLSATDLLDYADASASEGMTRFDEIDVDHNGRIEIDGDDASGRDLEIDFMSGSLQPTKVERDD